MKLPRTALPFVMVLLLALLVVACGGGESSRDAGSTTDRSSERDGEAGEDAAEGDAVDTRDPAERTTGGAFAITPELASCMESAGFAQDAPPTGGLAAWRHSTGGRVVVASSEDVTDGIADEIGTEFLAEVSDRVVLAAPAEHAQAADDCLRRFAG